MNKALKRTFTVLFSAFMVVPTAVHAEGNSYIDDPRTTEGTIDKTMKGSITLYKYIDNDGVSADADGVAYAGSREAMEKAIQDKLGSDVLPEKGVRFKLLKVADIEQITNDQTKGSKTDGNGNNATTDTGLNVSGTYYTNLDEEFFNTMNKYLGEGDRLTPARAAHSTDVNHNALDANGHGKRTAHYESDELNEKLMTVNRKKGITADGEDGEDLLPTGEVALNRIVRQRAQNLKVAEPNSNDSDVGYCKEFELTAKDGYTSLDNLPLGLYLICEVDYEHSSLSKYDNYWEQVDDEYNDAVGDGNTNSNANNRGQTADGETVGDQKDAQSEKDSGVRSLQDTDKINKDTTKNSSTSAGELAGGSSYADIVSPSSPFLISVPTTNTATVKGSDGETHAPGTVWQYDITAFPKNGTLTIHKDIIVNDYASNKSGNITNDGNDQHLDETLCDFDQTNYTDKHDDHDKPSKLDGDQTNGLTHQIDANIGDIVTQLVSVDVPRLVDDIDDETDIDAANKAGLKEGQNTNSGVANHNNTHRKHNSTFIVKDRMTKGLNLIDHDPAHFTVTLGQGRWNDGGTVLSQGTDYSIDYSDDRTSFTLTMLEPGLEKLDNIPSASYLYIKYDTVLTKDALIGTDTYSNQRTVVKAPQTTLDPEKGNNTGTTEEDVSSDKITDEVTSKAESYTSTYPHTGADRGTHKNSVTTTHPDATNQNTAELIYATDRTQRHEYYSNTTKVFTYELDLTKTFTDGTQGNVSKHDTEGTNGNNKEFDYSKVRFTVRGSTKPDSDDGKLASVKDNNGFVKHAYGYGSIPVLDVNNKNQARTGNDDDSTGITKLVNPDSSDNTWEQMLFIKTGDGTYRVWDPLTDNNASFDTAKETTSLDTTYKGAAADKTESYTVDNSTSTDKGTGVNAKSTSVGTVSKYLIPNTKTGLLTVKGLDARTYELTEVSTAPGRNLMAENFYVQLVAPTTPHEKSSGNFNDDTDLENGSVAHAYVWTGNKPAKIEDYDIKNYEPTAARLAMGRIPLTVQNNEVIKVLKTGGKGVWAYVGIGAGVIALGAYMLHRKNKEDEEENANPTA